MPITFRPDQLLLRWPQPRPSDLALWQSVKANLVVADHFDDSLHAKAAAQATTLCLSSELPTLDPAGLWPGIRRPPSSRGRNVEVASASREPWIDSNLYLAPYRRALHPQQLPILAYQANAQAGLRPDQDTPFHTLGLALIEARLAGANILLDLPPRFRAALDRQDPAALSAWKNLGELHRFLSSHGQFLGRPALPIVSALVDDSLPSREIANLLFRRGVSPRLVAASPLPKPHPATLALVAAGLRAVPPAVFAHAAAGATVILDTPPPAAAQLRKQEADRNFYSLGRGAVVSYHKRIADPSEFAYDVIDVITHKRRPCRLWNASSAIATASEGALPGQALLFVVNYGEEKPESEIQAHIQGHYTRAELLSPGRSPQLLPAARRGPSTEVFLQHLPRLAILRFSSENA